LNGRRAGGRGAVAAAAPPLLVGLAVLAGWEALIRARGIPEYILPGPLAILRAMIEHRAVLAASLWVTLEVTATALVTATVAGGLLAVLLSQARWIERGFYPLTVVLQVTPLVAIAPLIILWVKDVRLALWICASLAAFFPIVANTVLGLKSADHGLLDLFELYGASRRQLLWHLRLPAALPYFLGGLRISGGLALIGAVVAEFVAGTGGAETGLAYRILESGYNLEIPRMFAALALLAAAGVAIFALLSGLSHWTLRRWHESARRREE
jgi:NitT/TauT family transport system permease protein